MTKHSRDEVDKMSHYGTPLCLVDTYVAKRGVLWGLAWELLSLSMSANIGWTNGIPSVKCWESNTRRN